MKQNKQSLFLAQKQKLREAGCEDYRESIKALFSKAFGISLDQSFKYEKQKDLDENASLFSSMVDRRAAGEPTSHILRSRSFWKDDFYIEELDAGSKEYIDQPKNPKFKLKTGLMIDQIPFS